MLSRVAERLYWMARYLERAEDTARLVRAYSHLMFDIPRSVGADWSVLVEILDAEDAFQQRYKNPTERNTVKFLLVDGDSPSSISHSIAWARENVRTTRDVLPGPTWELMNELGLLVEDRAMYAVKREHRFEFLESLIAKIQQLNGLIASTVLRDHSLWFLQLGQMIERADMTSRVIDVGDAVIIERGREQLTEIPTLWANLLTSLSATSAYRRKIGPTLEANQVFDFILSDAQFPRSMLYCFNQIEEMVGHLRGPAGLMRLTRASATKLVRFEAEEFDLPQLHQFILDLQEDIAEINDAIVDTWFVARSD